MTTPTPHGAPELPELPEPKRFFGHSDKMPMYTADEMRDYARAAIQAAGAVPEMASVGHQYLFPDPFGGDMWLNSPDEWNGHKPQGSREIFAASPSPLGREAGKEGSSDHLVPCATCRVPDGWQLVPKEPDGNMWSASRREFIKFAQQYEDTPTSERASIIGDIAGPDIYRAMLQAAYTGEEPSPDAPTSQIKMVVNDKLPDDVVVFMQDGKEVGRVVGINPGSAPREDGHG